MPLHPRAGRYEPGLFVGSLRHRRFRPAAHAFTYPVFMALLDIDRLEEQMQVSRFTAYNRWNWASFDERDHFGDASLPLRQRLADDARRRGLSLPDGQVLLITHLRYLGYCFNPVSFFYCFDRSSVLRLVLAEVKNTFGGSHNYWLQPDGAQGSTFRASAAKSLYVSPFMHADLDYGFSFTLPREQLVSHMTVAARDGKLERPLFDATLSLARRPWTAAEIRRVLVRHPVMTAKVTAVIHWEALRLWWKGVPVVPRETPTGEAGESARHWMTR